MHSKQSSDCVIAIRPYHRNAMNNIMVTIDEYTYCIQFVHENVVIGMRNVVMMFAKHWNGKLGNRNQFLHQH